MERFTISLRPDLAERFDRFISSQGYLNRSEAVRDLIRDKIDREVLEEEPEQPCVASLTYLYDHHELSLASRITAAHHAHHALTVSSMHMHLDPDTCMETVFLRGTRRAVQAYADRLLAVTGVRSGNLHIVSQPVDGHGHTHPEHAGIEPHHTHS